MRLGVMKVQIVEYTYTPTMSFGSLHRVPYIVYIFENGGVLEFFTRTEVGFLFFTILTL